MVRNGEFGIEDVKRVIHKYWWVVPTCIVVSGALGASVATLLPKKYTSQTMVLVAKPTVPTEYVKPVVTEDLNRRLASMQEQILSRTRLEPVIEQFGLYHEDRNKVHMEELIDRLRKAIEISPLAPMTGTEDRSMPGFSVKVTFDNPQSAQQICTSITSMFMEQNASALEEQAVRTTSFLSEQLDEAKTKLDQQDAKLAQFKRQYMGSLPEEEQSNFYEGFSNEIVWPLFHDLQSRCNFDPRYWDFYERVNRKFADAVEKNHGYVLRYGAVTDRRRSLRGTGQRELRAPNKFAPRFVNELRRCLETFRLSWCENQKRIGVLPLHHAKSNQG